MTWDEVENTMTMPRLKALEEQWKKIPPLSITLSYLAQYHGMKLQKPEKSKEEFFQELKNLG